jgi:hypothetical protein
MNPRARAFRYGQPAQALGAHLSGRAGLAGNLIKYALMGVGTYLVEEGIEKVVGGVAGLREGRKKKRRRR